MTAEGRDATADVPVAQRRRGRRGGGGGGSGSRSESSSGCAAPDVGCSRCSRRSRRCLGLRPFAPGAVGILRGGRRRTQRPGARPGRPACTDRGEPPPPGQPGRRAGRRGRGISRDPGSPPRDALSLLSVAALLRGGRARGGGLGPGRVPAGGEGCVPPPPRRFSAAAAPQPGSGGSAPPAPPPAGAWGCPARFPGAPRPSTGAVPSVTYRPVLGEPLPQHGAASSLQA